MNHKEAKEIILSNPEVAKEYYYDEGFEAGVHATVEKIKQDMILYPTKYFLMIDEIVAELTKSEGGKDEV